MPKRITDEERIVEYFTFEEQAKVEVIFHIVQGIMRKRTANLTTVRKQKAKAAESVASQFTLKEDELKNHPFFSEPLRQRRREMAAVIYESQQDDAQHAE